MLATKKKAQSATENAILAESPRPFCEIRDVTLDADVSYCARQERTSETDPIASCGSQREGKAGGVA